MRFYLTLSRFLFSGFSGDRFANEKYCKQSKEWVSSLPEPHFFEFGLTSMLSGKDRRPIHTTTTDSSYRRRCGGRLAEICLQPVERPPMTGIECLFDADSYG